MTPVGYSHLIRQYQLPVLPMDAEARVTSGVRGREVRQQSGQLLLLVEPKYQPESSLAGHLQFALRYEGVNLQTLAMPRSGCSRY